MTIWISYLHVILPSSFLQMLNLNKYFIIVIQHTRLTLSSIFCYSQYLTLMIFIARPQITFITFTQQFYSAHHATPVPCIHAPLGGQANDTPVHAPEKCLLQWTILLYISRITTPSDQIVGNSPSTQLSGTFVTPARSLNARHTSSQCRLTSWQELPSIHLPGATSVSPVRRLNSRKTTLGRRQSCNCLSLHLTTQHYHSMKTLTCVLRKSCALLRHSIPNNILHCRAGSHITWLQYIHRSLSSGVISLRTNRISENKYRVSLSYT